MQNQLFPEIFAIIYYNTVRTNHCR